MPRSQTAQCRRGEPNASLGQLHHKTRHSDLDPRRRQAPKAPLQHSDLAQSAAGCRHGVSVRPVTADALGSADPIAGSSPKAERCVAGSAIAVVAPGGAARYFFLAVNDGPSDDGQGYLSMHPYLIDTAKNIQDLGNIRQVQETLDRLEFLYEALEAEERELATALIERLHQRLTEFRDDPAGHAVTAERP